MDYKLLIILFLIGTVPLFTGVMAVDLTIQKDGAADDLLNYTVYTNSYGVDQFWVDNNGFVYANGTLVTGGASGDSISEGDSKMEVIDTGFGELEFRIDGQEYGNWTATKGLSISIPDYNNKICVQFNDTTQHPNVSSFTCDASTWPGVSKNSGFSIGSLFDSTSNGNLGLSSYSENYGSGNVIANWGYARGYDTGQIWGGNFIAATNHTLGSGGNAHGIEVNFGNLVATTAKAFGIIIHSFGGNGGEAYLEFAANDAGSRTTGGVIRFSGDLVNGGDLIYTSGNPIAVDGIDLSAATFSGDGLSIATANKGIDLSGGTFTTAGIDMGGSKLDNVGNLELGASGSLTIATGAITIITSFYSVDTEGAAASDDLDTINGGNEGSFLILKNINAARTVVIKDSTGNIRTPTDCLLTHPQDTFFAIKVGTAWLQLACNDNA